MGAIDIGRTGSLGIGVEAVPSTAVAAAVFLSYSDGPTLRGHHEPIENISSRTSRLMDSDSVIGKKWGEGNVQILCDVVNSGYLWKVAMGNEQYVSGTPDYHTFYATISGNAPKTATLIHSRGSTDVEQFTYSAIDELTFEVSDSLATLTASFMSRFPTTATAQTVSTTSGSILAFRDYFIQFGANLTAAGTAVATPLSAFTLTIANNLEMIHRSGSNDVSAIRTKGMRVSGSYTLFFDSVTERNKYYLLEKRAMIMTASGYSNESLRLRVPEFRVNEADISTGLDDFYTITANFVVEDDIDSGVRFLDIRLANEKESVY